MGKKCLTNSPRTDNHQHKGNAVKSQTEQKKGPAKQVHIKWAQGRIAILDKRLGKDVGAKVERARLAKLIG